MKHKEISIAIIIFIFIFGVFFFSSYAIEDFLPQQDNINGSKVKNKSNINIDEIKERMDEMSVEEIQETIEEINKEIERLESQIN